MSWWLSQHSQARLTSSWHFHTETECRALPSLRLTLSNSFQHHLQINAFIKLQGLHWWSDIKINRCLLSYYNEELVWRDYIHYCKQFTSYKSLIWGFTYFSFGWQCCSYCSCYFGDESLEHLTYVEWINITRHAEKSCPVCQVPLAKGNSEVLVPSVSIPTCTHHPEPSRCHPSLRARAPSWVQLSTSPWILAGPRQVRILPYPRNDFSSWCNTGRWITVTCKESATASVEEMRHTENVAAWDRVRMGFMCPEPPACSAREGKSRLGWAWSNRRALQAETTAMFDLQSS